MGKKQTNDVKEIKKMCQTPPPLHIPNNGQLILQTDASDEHWATLLIEKSKKKEHYCGHASGQFSDAKKHYHISIKEILTVKNGIKKFEFYFIHQHFIIRMDNSTFSKILDYRNKLKPEPQLLRLKDWFSKYQFSVVHIKGTPTSS